MSQENVYKHLKKNKNRWFSAKDLEEPIDSNLDSIRKSLNGLLKRGEVERICTDYSPKIGYLWKFKK
jgi:predicted transcriptional regulator